MEREMVMTGVKRIMLFRYLVCVLCIQFAPMPVEAWGGGSGGEGGCCSALSDENLSRIADAYGVPRTTADQILNDVLATYSTEELRMLQAMPGEACRTQGDYLCEIMPDEFFRFLVEEEQARRADTQINRRARWDTIQKVALAIIAFAGLGLGLANRYRPRT
jgi:hypothetical protein